MPNLMATLQTVLKKPATPPKVAPAVAATPATPTVAPTPNYLQTAITGPGTIDPNALQGRATQAIANQQLPDQAPIYQAAQKSLKTLKGTPEEGLGEIVLADYENKVKAYGQQASNWGMATQTKTEATQAYLGQVQSLQAKADKAWVESTASWNKGSQLADKYIADASADMARITSQIRDLTDRYATEPQTALVGSIVSGVTGFLQANKANERAIAERYGTDSAEMASWQGSKRVSIGAMVGDLTAKAWDRTMAIRNTGIGALSTAATALATNVNWVRQKSLDFEQARAAASDALGLNLGAYQASLAGMENTALGEFATWLDESPVAMPEAAPMMQQLMELYDSYQARQLAQEQLGIQRDAANAPVTVANIQSNPSKPSLPYSSPGALTQV